MAPPLLYLCMTTKKVFPQRERERERAYLLFCTCIYCMHTHTSQPQSHTGCKAVNVQIREVSIVIFFFKEDKLKSDFHHKGQATLQGQ